MGGGGGKEPEFVFDCWPHPVLCLFLVLVLFCVLVLSAPCIVIFYQQGTTRLYFLTAVPGSMVGTAHQQLAIGRGSSHTKVLYKIHVG